MFMSYKLDYRIYKKWYGTIAVLAVIILFLVLVPGIGKSVNGAKRWIVVPIVKSLQTSEITKMGVIIALARIFCKLQRNYKKSKKFLDTSYIFSYNYCNIDWSSKSF